MTTPTGNQGTVSVAVVPDTTGFAAQVDRQLRQALSGIGTRVRAALAPMERAFEQAGRAAGQQLAAGARAATAELRQMIPVARQAATALGRVDRQATAASGSLTSLTLAAWSANSALARIGNQNVLGSSDMERRLEEIAEAVRDAARDINAVLEPALAGLRASMDRTADSIERDADRAGDAIGSEITRGVLAANTALALLGDGGRHLGVLGAASGRASAGLLGLAGSLTGSLAGGLLSVTGSLARMATTLTAVSLGAASLIQAVGSLVAALAPLSGILAAIPAAGLSVVAVFKTIGVAVEGVGSTISAYMSGDYKAFFQGLKELEPAAAKFALAIVKLGPRFNELKDAIQQSFFAGMTKAFGDLGSQLLTIGERFLPKLAAELGNVADEFLRVARTGALTGGLIETLKATNRGIGGLKDEAGLLADAFGHLLLVGSKFVDRMWDGIGRLIERFSTWVITASNTGELEERINAAIDTFKQLGRIAGNVGDILSGIFDAGADNGRTLLDTIEQVTRLFADFVNSAQGQNMFGAIFQAASDITQNVLIPALSTLLPILGDLVAIIAVHLSAALVVVQPYLDALFTTIANSAPEFLGLVNQGLDVLVAGLEQLLPVIVELLPVFREIGQAVGGALLQVFRDIKPVIMDTVAALQPLIPQFVDFARLIATTLGSAVTQLVTAFAPLVPVLLDLGMNIASTLVPILADLAVILAQGLADAIVAVAPTLGRLLDAVRAAAPAFTRLVQRGVEFLLSALVKLMPVIERLFPIFLDLALTAGSALLDVLEALVPVFEEAWRAIEPMLPQLTALAQQVFAQLVSAALALLQAVTPLVPILVEIGVQLLAALLPAFRDILEAIQPLIPELGRLAEQILLALLDVVRELTPLLPDIVNAFVQLMPSVVDLVPAVLDLLDAFLPLLPILTDLAVVLIQELLPVLLPIAEGYMEMARILVESLTPAIELFVLGVWAIVEAVKATIEGIKEFISDTTERFERGLERWGEIWDGFKEKVSEAWDAIKGFVSDSLRRIGEAIADAGIFFWEMAAQAFREIVRALEAVFVDAPTWLFNAGKDIIQGLIDGLIDKAKKLPDVVKGWIVDPIQSALGGVKGFWFGSPSKVTTQYGQWISEGLAIGMEDAERQVVAAAEAITRAAALPGMATAPGAGMLPASLGAGSFAPSLAAPAAAGAVLAPAPVNVTVIVEGSASEEDAQRIGAAAGSALRQALAERDARLAVKGLT